MHRQPLHVARMAHSVFIEPLHTRLITWGSTAVVQSSDFQPGHLFHFHVNPEHINFDAHFQSHRSADSTTLLLNFAFVMVCICLVLICLHMSGDGNDDEPDDGTPSTQKTDSLRDVQFREGSWAHAYREAKGEEREALELLFRCHIISTYEFAESKVNQEHIDECVWIGTHMLHQKPLAEWVAMRYQAKEAFEGNAVASFQADSDSVSSRQRLCTSITEHTERQNLGTSSSGGFTSSSGVPNLSVDSQEKAMPRVVDPLSAPEPQKNLGTSSSGGFTSSSGVQNLSVESQQKAMPRVVDPISAPEPQQRIFRPALQPPRTDRPITAEPKHKSHTTQPHQPAPQQKVQIPRMDLGSLSSAKEQSSREDDDDPYTTRDHP